MHDCHLLQGLLEKRNGDALLITTGATALSIYYSKDHLFPEHSEDV